MVDDGDDSDVAGDEVCCPSLLSFFLGFTFSLLPGKYSSLSLAAAPLPQVLTSSDVSIPDDLDHEAEICLFSPLCVMKASGPLAGEAGLRPPGEILVMLGWWLSGDGVSSLPSSSLEAEI